MAATFGHTLLGDVGLEASCSGGAQHGSCPFGWTFADGACFKLFGGVLGEPLGWVDAEEACLQHGSEVHLAGITSAEQQRAAEHLAGGSSVWIGLNDAEARPAHEVGIFSWTDGEPLEYQHWGAGHPDNAEGGHQSAVFSNIEEHGWDDGPQTSQIKCPTSVQGRLRPQPQLAAKWMAAVAGAG